MSLAEKIYLGMVLFLFFGFMGLMATVCWLDGQDSRIQRRRDRAAVAGKSGSYVASGTAHQH